MKIGLKLFPEKLHLIDKYKDIFYFFEVFIKPDMDLNLLNNLDVPITVHAAHFSYGFNPTDPKRDNLNKKILNKAILAADISNAKWIIIHPGWMIDKNSEKNMIDFFKENYDKRFVFENCPYIDYAENEERYLFSTPNKMKTLIKKLNSKMILDFSHAICTANILKKDPKKIIKEFLNLKPKGFHVSGIDIDGIADNHKYLFESNNDYSFLKLVGKTKFLTLETNYKGINKRSNHLKDLEIINSIN